MAQNMMQNPQMMQMAQNMMADPRAMEGMLGALGGAGAAPAPAPEASSSSASAGDSAGASAGGGGLGGIFNDPDVKAELERMCAEDGRARAIIEDVKANGAGAAMKYMGDPHAQQLVQRIM